MAQPTSTSDAQPLDLWEAPRWSILVQQKALIERFPQSLPFARVGSHPSCELRLKDLPPLAYLICLVSGVVEAWPLAPLAMARSGPLEPGERFSVGSRRISVELSESDSKSNPALGNPEPVSLDVSGMEKRWQASLRRSITIMGDDHPSLLRIGAVGLRPCHVAFVSVPEGLWYIDLEAPSSAAARALELDAPLSVGSLTILPQRTTASKHPAKPNRLAATEPEPTSAPSNGADVNGETSLAHADLFTEDITHRIVRMGRRKKLMPRLRKGLLVCLVIVLAAIVVMQIYHAVSDQLPGLGPSW